MLYHALMFLAATLVAGVVGFAGIPGTISLVGQLLFFGVLVCLVVSLVVTMLQRSR